ncbi:protein SRC2-like [Vitis riparia]|uniref:protein SRC2-like n=1 Tax=Vitis riparia TaxID=96939 RepID=UPI00155AA4D2|nr:protein SRC2-like [Vitis riparia]
MKVYAKLSITGNSQTERTSPVDTEGETNPAWNFTTGYTIGKKAVEYQGIMLVIKLYCSRTLGDWYIGEVSVSFKDLFDGAVATGGSTTVSYPVKKGAVDSKGVLKFSHSFGDIVIVEVAFGGGLDDLDISFSGEDVLIDVDVLVDSSGSSQDPKN